ncbi:MAG: Holliday junction resolvase-like protein [Dehalococcoidia bacterium]|nr:Holliday junction resolvase-like protein [Dehalococcoidia bacterium]
MELPLLIVIAALLALTALLLIRMHMPRSADLTNLEESLRSYFTGATATLASDAAVKEVLSCLNQLPRDILHSITSSVSARSGRLHELLATYELTHYDRLFYLGEPVDFVGIKYDEGIDFIEVKSGRSRLTPDEQRLQNLVEDRRVNYVVLSVKRIGIADDITTEPGE